MEDVPTDTRQEKPSKVSAKEVEETTAPEETRRRSARVRRSPVRYNAAEAAIGAVFLLMGLLAPLLGVGTAEGRHFESFNRDGVVFKYQEDIFFSDSEWVVVTDVSFTPIETALAAVRQWYLGQMRDDPRRAEAKEGERLRTQLRDRAREGLGCLEVIDDRYQVLRGALVGTTDRKKRGLVNAGGTTLQWLFGVATERDLEGVNDHLQALSKETTAIVHAVAHQASMVNDTWRELGEHALIMQQLDKAHRALEKEVNRWRVNMLETVNSLEWQFIMGSRIDEAFRSAQRTLDWVRMTLEDFGVGLAMLAVGKLPPELFPPSRLRKVLKEIRPRLNAGWDLTPALQAGNLWKAYQEAQVVSAATTHGLRLFIHLPVIEVTRNFELYETFVLPVFGATGEFGLQYANIPAFLAVDMDRQTFIELSEADVRSCQGRAGAVCPPRGAIYRKNFRKTCAMALFLQDPERTKADCDKVVVEWKGPEAKYLGHRQWAVSMKMPRSLVMACPLVTGARDFPKAELPSVGIVEIPRGCSVQTDEWILQASHQYSMTSTKSGSDFTPRLKGVHWPVATDWSEKRGGASEQPVTLFPHISLAASLKRIASDKATADNFGKTVRAIDEGDKERREGALRPQACPYELWGGLLAATMLCSGAFVFWVRRGGGRGREVAELYERVGMLEGTLRGEMEERRSRRWATTDCLTQLDGRLKAHERTCMAALTELEEAARA